jgi:hypothetical protein
VARLLVRAPPKSVPAIWDESHFRLSQLAKEEITKRVGRDTLTAALPA